MKFLTVFALLIAFAMVDFNLVPSSAHAKGSSHPVPPQRVNGAAPCMIHAGDGVLVNLNAVLSISFGPKQIYVSEGFTSKWKAGVRYNFGYNSSQEIFTETPEEYIRWVHDEIAKCRGDIK